MPKMTNTWNEHLAFHCDRELKETILAISYMEGDLGEYARWARVLLKRAVEDYLLELTPKQRKEYEVHLQAVQAQQEIERQERMEKRKRKLEKSIGNFHL
jgi:hypothetical protein